MSPFLETIRIGHAKKWIKGNNLLDCGCGRGRLLDLIGSDYNYTGIDMDPALIDYLSNKYPKSNFIKGDLNKILELVPDEKYDTIILAALIEHVSQPISLILNLRKLLKPNGIIIITTPSPSFEMIYHYGSKFGIFDKHADEDHEDLISIKKLIGIVKESKLSLLKSYRFLFGANQIVVGEKTDL
jgi:2-polyprenyl-3-methyl-5-hydroxy-6-metoxy-1,4-benzoquinol methylase